MWRRKGKEKRFRVSAAVLLAAVLLLLPSCEAMPEQTVSSAASAAPAPVVSEGGGKVEGGLPTDAVYEEDEESEREVTYRVEEYTLREEHLEFYVTYPQLDGTKHEEINALLKERGLQIAESLLLEEEKRQEALSASSAPADESGSSASASSQAEPAGEEGSRLVTLMGGSECYVPSSDFLSVSFTMDISDTTQAIPSKEWYSLNYDLRRGEEVTCADLFADLDGLAAALREQVEKDELDESLQNYLTRDRLRAGLPGVPVAFGIGFAEFGFPVPRSSGDVIRISLPLRKAAAYRSDNTLWDAIGTS
ncbi:MAG: hypothetical protein U0N62_12955 [Hydrogeniiclostridium sp.]